MDFIAGYESVKKLKEVSGYIFYKAVSSESKQKVIIASFRHQLSPSQCVSLKQAFSICEPIELSNVLFPLDLELSDETVFLVFEDTGAIFLPLLQSKGAFGLEVFFDVAIKVSEILTQLHDKHLFHGDLRPINILYDEINKQVVLSGICYHPKIEKFFDIFPLTPLFEAYVYTSPEQTGRVNWEVDQRSDLYSLGIIFYEMVCGCVPFRGETPDQRIFGHLAVTPPELYQFCPILPKMVNQVIRKLLSKGMGDRYQSVFGLLKDLERCQKEYLDKKTISDFELGSSDLMNQYHIPTRLYGSQENFTLLLESLNRVCEGNIELATIQGAAGTGKSSLVLELIDAVYQKKGFVAKGKFEKEYIDTPYYPLINAFKGIIRQILTEKDVDIDKWKERFLTNIGKNGQILIDFIPEIEIIIGEQPPLPNLDPLESKKRFNHLFAKFIQSFSYRGKPFLIVLDNFHWADAASIQFIQNFLSDPGNRYVLVVIIYREGAFEQNHTFFVALTELRNLGIRIQEIKLSPLTVEDIGVFIKDSLGVKQNYRSLSQLIFEKSRGNPFFVRQLLQSLYEKKQITFDVTTSKWHWEIKQIKQLEIFEDVVVLITDKINELPGELIEILKIAACVGFEFDINILEFITGKDNDEIAALLELPLKSGLILPKTKSWEQSDRQVSFISKSNIKKIKNFQFLHSRIHQAAYSLLSSQEKKQNHLKIGRIILSNTKSKDLKTNPYQIVNQLNQAIILLTKRSEKLELAKLNLTAGILSKASAAHDSAWKYFAYGTDLLDEKSWQTDYELTKELYLGRSECEYYSGNTEAAKPIFTLLLEHVHTIEEKVEVIIRKLNLLIKNGELKEAIQTGISALKDLFSEKIPVNDAEVTIISQVMMQEMQSDLEISNVEKLFFLPSMKKSEEIMIMELITNIIPAAYIAKRHLWILLTIKMVQKSLKHGNCFYSSYGYMNLAVILCSGLEDYQTGYAIGKLALKLNEKYQDPRLLAKLYFLFGSYINHWKNDAHENLDYLNKAYQVGVDLGDWISAGNSLKFLIKTHLFIGTPIEQVIKELEVH
ncbi:MAG: AAA family ATPase, partial [Deltaproteobacteria bacterium]|nr:AAA family ATPase [Deltaproteobacteria bacterium]